ncbi:MAG: cellulase family glycosylhydrolase [Aggregatilineaceae bacterium]
MNAQPTRPRTLFGFQLRTLAVLTLLALLATGALALDLASEGLVYDYFWEVTGETSPLEQLLGFGQYLVRWTRAQPDTQPYADIPLADVNPFGVNTFLEQEVEPAKRERQMQLIAEAGFGWIRQPFPWEDIEIHAKGDFTDRRNLDVHGEISAWDKYDHIVALAEQYGLRIIARLGGPMPAWSLSPGTTNRYTPPADFQDFVDYAVAVATRYRGRIQHYQVWNEPNLYPEWGEQTVNAEAYTDLLCRTYHALKAIDPQIVVITGAIGPTIDLSGRNAYDVLYLQRMYQAGAGACFDVLAVQGYGLWSGPTDRRLRPTTINYQRHLYLRDVMVANGDAHKPIWISEAGWNPVPDDPTIADLERYGRVTMEQAAAWGPLAYQRAAEEWPWVGVIAWWYFKRADESERGQSWYYFRLVEPDFTPTPVYEALKAYMTGDRPQTLGAGRHGLTARGVITTGPDSNEIRTFRVRGTAIYLCHDALPDARMMTLRVDGGAAQTLALAAGAARCIPLSERLGAGVHTLALSAEDWSGLRSLVVLDHSARQRLPWLLAGLVAAVGALAVLGRAVTVRLDSAAR